jgi:hypothetical protein
MQPVRIADFDEGAIAGAMARDSSLQVDIR